MSDDADFDAADDNGDEDSFNRADDAQYDDYQDDNDAADFDNDSNTDEHKHNPIHTSTSFSASPSPLPASDSQNYECLDEAQLRAHMDSLVADVASVIDQPTDKAALLLRTHQWNKERLIARYFEQPQQLLMRVGLEHYDEADDEREETMSDSGGTVSCPICDEEYELRDTYSLGDGHRFCSSCWRDFLTSALANGRAVVLTRCPAYQCNSLVHDATFRRMCSAAEYERFMHFVLRSYVEDNRSMRWCTHPGCPYALHALNHTVLSVSCRAGHKFCFQCQEEWHEPCTCEQLVRWREKNTTESDNAHWIIANTKRCPQCSVRIEKNQGCNHITCRHCKYEWCWVCNGDWKEHGNHTGGFYKCNKYNPKEAKKADRWKVEQPADSSTTTTTAAAHHPPSNDTAKAERDAELNRYLFYYQRYHNHAESAKFAAQLRQETDKKIQSIPASLLIDVQYLAAATECVLECRHVLKYTYVFAYFLSSGGSGSPQSHDADERERERNLFEFLQQQLEKSVEALSEATEQRTEVLQRREEKSKIVNYTRVTKSFRDNLLAGVRNGLTG